MTPAQGDAFDYVICGGGTAGCVLASRLSEDREVRVCLIEAGPPDTHPFIHVPALVGAAIAVPALNWRFRTVPQPALNNRVIAVPRGRVLGGSGSINGMAYFRGQPQDFDDWAAAGNPGWSWREVLPYFLRSESNDSYPQSPLHGRDGPIKVSHVPRPNLLNAAFREAFDQLGGYTHSEDFNGVVSEGYGLRQGTIRNGRRDSTAAAFLKPVRHRGNLVVVTGTQVTRVLLEAGRAVGVEVRDNGALRRIVARRETLLCAGAIQSPQLLMLSGIGDGAALQALGVRVERHLPGVGANFHDHLAAPVLMETGDTQSYGLSLRTLPRAALNLLQYAFNRSGPLASNLFESTAFIRSSPEATRPDLQLAFQPARRNKGTFPIPLGHGFALSAVSLYPHSRGRITLASPDVADAPLLDPNLLGDPRDIAPLVHGLQLSRRLFATAAFARYRAVEVAPGREVVTQADLQDYIRRTASTVHHPVGTCRMGTDAGSVVNAQLQVHGIDALRVVDASIFPSIVGGNTNAGVVMVAEKAADLLRGRSPPAPLQV